MGAWPSVHTKPHTPTEPESVRTVPVSRKRPRDDSPTLDIAPTKHHIAPAKHHKVAMVLKREADDMDIERVAWATDEKDTGFATPWSSIQWACPPVDVGHPWGWWKTWSTHHHRLYALVHRHTGEPVTETLDAVLSGDGGFGVVFTVSFSGPHASLPTCPGHTQLIPYTQSPQQLQLSPQLPCLPQSPCPPQPSQQLQLSSQPPSQSTPSRMASVLKVAIAPSALDQPMLRPELIEAWVYATFVHPCITRCLSMGFHPETARSVLVLKRYVTNLDQTLGATCDLPRALGVAWTVMWDIGHALMFLHAHGVMHRDVKPANVLISIEDDTLNTDTNHVDATGPDTTGTNTDTRDMLDTNTQPVSPIGGVAPGGRVRYLLTDFGLSGLYPPIEEYNRACPMDPSHVCRGGAGCQHFGMEQLGTPPYTAPEIMPKDPRVSVPKRVPNSVIPTSMIHTTTAAIPTEVQESTSKRERPRFRHQEFESEDYDSGPEDGDSESEDKGSDDTSSDGTPSDTDDTLTPPPIPPTRKDPVLVADAEHEPTRYGPAADVFSLGATVVRLLIGGEEVDQPGQWIRRLDRWASTIEWHQGPAVAWFLYQLIRSMVALDPYKRPTMHHTLVRLRQMGSRYDASGTALARATCECATGWQHTRVQSGFRVPVHPRTVSCLVVQEEVPPGYGIECGHLTNVGGAPGATLPCVKGSERYMILRERMLPGSTETYSARPHVQPFVLASAVWLLDRVYSLFLDQWEDEPSSWETTLAVAMWTIAQALCRPPPTLEQWKTLLTRAPPDVELGALQRTLLVACRFAVVTVPPSTTMLSTVTWDNVLALLQSHPLCT